MLDRCRTEPVKMSARCVTLMAVVASLHHPSIENPPIKSGGKKRQISRPPAYASSGKSRLVLATTCVKRDNDVAVMSDQTRMTMIGAYPLMDIDRISRLITRRIERRRKTNRANSTSMFINRVWGHLHKLIRLLWRRHGQLVGMQIRKPTVRRVGPTIVGY